MSSRATPIRSWPNSPLLQCVPGLSLKVHPPPPSHRGHGPNEATGRSASGCGQTRTKRILQMPSRPVRSTNFFQHLLVFVIDINTKIIFPGKERRTHIIYEDRDLKDVIITPDMGQPDLTGGKSLEFFHRLHRIVHPVFTDILWKIVPQFLVARG